MLQIKCVYVDREGESEKRERGVKRKRLSTVQGKTASACLFSWVGFCVAAADDPP